MGYAQIDERFWVDTADWPLHARMIYLWSIANTHGQRLCGIGEVPDVVVGAEVGFNGARLRNGWQWLVDQRRMLRVGHWYFNFDCIRYNCWYTHRESGELRVDRNHVLGIVNYLRANNVPAEIARAVIAEYPELFEGDLVNQIGMASGIGPRPKSRRIGGGGGGGGGGAPPGGGSTRGEGVGASGYPGTRPSDQPS